MVPQQCIAAASYTVQCLSAAEPANHTQLTVTFTKATDNALHVCQINMEPVADCALDFMPATFTFFPTQPHLNMATIQCCGHTFHAASLVYHFLRNTMACPCCRAGDTLHPVQVSSFDASDTAIADLHEYASKLHLREKEDQIREEQDSIVAMFISAHIMPTFNFEYMPDIDPICSFFAFDSTQNFAMPQALAVCIMHPHTDTENPIDVDDNSFDRIMHFRAMPSDLRRVSGLLTQERATNSIILHVSTRNPRTRNPVLLAQSPPISLSDIPLPPQVSDAAAKVA
jgi:hypothetical protein